MRLRENNGDQWGLMRLIVQWRLMRLRETTGVMRPMGIHETQRDYWTLMRQLGLMRLRD